MSFQSFRIYTFSAALAAAALLVAAGPSTVTVRADASASAAVAGGGERLGIWFTHDPLSRPDLVVEGAAADRVTWVRDRPAFPGDRPGALTARFDALAAPGLLGFDLPSTVDEETTFTAAAVMVIRSAGLVADPAGFFQISWGLWNGDRTGLERTGNPQDFSGDTFELMEFDWFPNRTPFGGPFLSPILFGEARDADPLFPFLGCFANLSFAAQEADLPLDTPLLAVLEHRPDDDVLVVTVHRIVGARRLLPVPGAVAIIPLDALPLRAYALDTLGITLWRDGFSGPAPSLQADVVFHALAFVPGPVTSPERLLSVPPGRP